MPPIVQLASLVAEDLRAEPRAALADALERRAAMPADPAAQLDAVLSSLAAGEPKRALALLTPSLQSPRATAALQRWATLLDANLYPGGIGAETSIPVDLADIPLQPGTPIEMLLEQVVVNGPPSLPTVRTLLEGSLRNGQPAAAVEAAQAGYAHLNALFVWAQTAGFPAILPWATLAGADLFVRAGLAQAEVLLTQSRALAAADPVALALARIVEGDWHATPGSSPEALGWDLAAYTTPNPLRVADLARAAASWQEADRLLATAPAPPRRLVAALALRRALLDRAAGRAGDRDVNLGLAESAYEAAGDGAAAQVVKIHRVIADIDAGRLSTHAVHLGGGWHRPQRGPIAEVLEWSETFGSRSWCVGLGRLLQRCGEEWMLRSSPARARVALAAALALTSLEPELPVQTLTTALANADSRSNLAVNAQLRLERAFGDSWARTDDIAPFDFVQKLEASMVMVAVLNSRSRGAGAFRAADRCDELSAQLSAAADRLDAALPPAAGALPTTMDELRAAVQAAPGATLAMQAAATEFAMQLMRQTQVPIARSQVETLRVFGPLSRARGWAALGRLDEAERWFDAAVAAARAATTSPELLPVALISARRFDEAREAVSALSGRVGDDLLMTLAHGARDAAAARAALERLRAAGRAPSGWSDLLTQAEIELGDGDRGAARTTILAAIADLEGSVRSIPRDPERIDACDQPDIAALYSTLALTWLPAASTGDADASFDAAERLRALSSVADDGALSLEAAQSWRRTAAEYAAVSYGLLAQLPPPGADRAGVFARLDEADRRLAEAEQRAEAEDPGILLRRSAPAPAASAAQLRARMPEDGVVLSYLAVGDDLLSWAVTRDAVRPVTAKISARELGARAREFHDGCASGNAPDTSLGALLLEPFADLLRSHSRIVVVPFGPLTALPFHALRFDGVPLGADHIVSTAMRGADAFGIDFDRAASHARPLVVGDPAFDPAAHPGLRRLPGARVEAEAVAAALAAPPERLLVEDAATEPAVTGLLGGCDLLHISSHGHLDDLAPFASSLVLAGADELTVADIVGVRFGTDLAVLTGCDTGRGTATLGGDLVGLTRAMLRSGVRRTIVSLWPVDDAVAPVLMSRLYAELARGICPADALAAAQRAVAALGGAELERALTALGAESGLGRGIRRGALDPELIDDEAVPEPLSEAAERYWAPFVLVG